MERKPPENRKANTTPKIRTTMKIEDSNMANNMKLNAIACVPKRLPNKIKAITKEENSAYSTADVLKYKNKETVDKDTKNSPIALPHGEKVREK